LSVSVLLYTALRSMKVSRIASAISFAARLSSNGSGRLSGESARHCECLGLSPTRMTRNGFQRGCLDMQRDAAGSCEGRPRRC
jgi:hypothetical protein